MVNSDKGITNLHVPSDVIVDASMPAMIRAVGQDVGRRRQDRTTRWPSSPTAATPGSTRPSSTSARRTAPSIPKTMGSVPNVGLMAQAAEEYGSHNKTFEIPAERHRRASTDAAGNVLLEQQRRGRATSGAPARPKDAPIRDWVKLAVNRARATG